MKYSKFENFLLWTPGISVYYIFLLCCSLILSLTEMPNFKGVCSPLGYNAVAGVRNQTVQ